MAAPTYRLTNQALADLQQISDYLGERNPTAAHQVVQELVNTFKFLALNPETGTQRDDLHAGVRTFVAARPASNYVIFYSRIEIGVVITDVIHGSRNWVEMFLSGER